MLAPWILSLFVVVSCLMNMQSCSRLSSSLSVVSCVIDTFFQILCRKLQSGTSGSFWWIQRGRWSGTGEQTSPWRVLDKKPRRWCGKSSWRKGWSYDGDYWWMLDTPLWPPGIKQWGTMNCCRHRAGWCFAPERCRRLKSFRLTCLCVFVRDGLFVWKLSCG